MEPRDKEGFRSLHSRFLHSHLCKYRAVVKKEEESKYRDIYQKLAKAFEGEQTEERPDESEVQGEEFSGNKEKNIHK